jgi:hypothetical protein
MKTNLIPLAALLVATGAIFAGPTAAASPLPKICVMAEATSSCQPSHDVPWTGALPVITGKPYGDATQQGGR